MLWPVRHGLEVDGYATEVGGCSCSRDSVLGQSCVASASILSAYKTVAASNPGQRWEHHHRSATKAEQRTREMQVQDHCGVRMPGLPADPGAKALHPCTLWPRARIETESRGDRSAPSLTAPPVSI